MRIQAAILHIFDPHLNEPVYSVAGLDLQEEHIFDYIKAKVEKCLSSPQQKQCRLDEAADFHQKALELGENFLATSQAMSSQLFTLVRHNPDIPPADLLWVKLLLWDMPFVACFKLNHQEQMTHHVQQKEEGLVNELLLHHSILPKGKQALDECFLYCLPTRECFVLEKKHLMEETGEREFYFSEAFLKLPLQPAVKDQLNAVKKAVKKTAQSFNEDAYEALARAKEETVDAVMADEVINHPRLAQAFFPEEPAKQASYLEETANLGMPEESPAPKTMLSARMNRQKLKLGNGIELLVPLELFHEKDAVEIINQPDGTLNIILKNIEDIENLF